MQQNNKSSPPKKNLKQVKSYKELSDFDRPAAHEEFETNRQSAETNRQSTPTSAQPAKPEQISKRASMPTSARSATPEQISKRAYEIWNERGRPLGREVEHWLEAERELLGFNRSTN